MSLSTAVSVYQGSFLSVLGGETVCSLRGKMMLQDRDVLQKQSVVYLVVHLTFLICLHLTRTYITLRVM